MGRQELLALTAEGQQRGRVAQFAVADQHRVGGSQQCLAQFGHVRQIDRVIALIAIPRAEPQGQAPTGDQAEHELGFVALPIFVVAFDQAGDALAAVLGLVSLVVGAFKVDAGGIGVQPLQVQVTARDGGGEQGRPDRDLLLGQSIQQRAQAVVIQPGGLQVKQAVDTVLGGPLGDAVERTGLKGHTVDNNHLGQSTIRGGDVGLKGQGAVNRLGHTQPRQPALQQRCGSNHDSLIFYRLCLDEHTSTSWGQCSSVEWWTNPQSGGSGK